MDIIDVILKENKIPYGKPTDVIGFGSLGKGIANMLLPIIGQKEICFFDEKIKSDPIFHYLDFTDMLEKTEIMIFTVELPKKYYGSLVNLNKKCKIFLPKNFLKTISVFQKMGHNDNLVLF